MANKCLIEVKIPKGVLYLTPDEYICGLQRGKAIERSKQLNERLANSENTAKGKGDINETSN